jgi:hypothetical protein
MGKKLKVPIRYIRVASKQQGTTYIRGTHGRLKGRRALKSGVGYSTKVRYVTKDVDVNHDGRIDFHGGQVVGRTKAVKVRGSRNRGTIRRL